MWKKLLVRAYHGFSITMIVDLIVHFVVAEAVGSAVTPAFAARFSGEAAATIAQLMLVALIGMTFAASAAIFEIERWSFLLQGIVHFLVTAAVWMPIACICWAPVSGIGMVFTILGWTLTYFITWTVQYILWKKQIREINRSVLAYRRREERA